MIKLLQAIWARISLILFPKDYYSWQTLIYLGFFSFAMSWVARVAVGVGWTVNIIATFGWMFFVLGIGWLLNKSGIKFFGIPVAPWVMGAMVCVYIFGLIPWGSWPAALMAWPLVSVLIIAIPKFFNWELRPRVPPPPARLELILFVLAALLFSNWFQFYFRLQDWFIDYPSLLADDFSRSGFVYRVSDLPEEQARGVVLLTSAEMEIRDTLSNTPWPYVERWLLNLDERLVNLQVKTIDALETSEEQPFWRLEARTRGLGEKRYALDLMAVWLGPASTQTGYYLEKTCIIYARSPITPTAAESLSANDSDQRAAVECDLATPKRPGRPPQTA